MAIQQQVQIAEDQLVQEVDVPCLAPCGSQELIPVMDNAHEAGIAVVVTIDNANVFLN